MPQWCSGVDGTRGTRPRETAGNLSGRSCQARQGTYTCAGLLAACVEARLQSPLVSLCHGSIQSGHHQCINLRCLVCRAPNTVPSVWTHADSSIMCSSANPVKHNPERPWLNPAQSIRLEVSTPLAAQQQQTYTYRTPHCTVHSTCACKHSCKIP